MRCRACDAILMEQEMVIREETNDFEDLCTVCRKAAENTYEIESEIGLIVERYELDKWDD